MSKSPRPRTSAASITPEILSLREGFLSAIEADEEARRKVLRSLRDMVFLPLFQYPPDSLWRIATEYAWGSESWQRSAYSVELLHLRNAVRAWAEKLGLVDDWFSEIAWDTLRLWSNRVTALVDKGRGSDVKLRLHFPSRAAIPSSALPDAPSFTDDMADVVKELEASLRKHGVDHPLYAETLDSLHSLRCAEIEREEIEGLSSFIGGSWAMLRGGDEGISLWDPTPIGPPRPMTWIPRVESREDFLKRVGRVLDEGYRRLYQTEPKASHLRKTETSRPEDRMVWLVQRVVLGRTFEDLHMYLDPEPSAGAVPSPDTIRKAVDRLAKRMGLTLPKDRT